MYCKEVLLRNRILRHGRPSRAEKHSTVALSSEKAARAEGKVSEMLRTKRSVASECHVLRRVAVHVVRTGALAPGATSGHSARETRRGSASLWGLLGARDSSLPRHAAGQLHRIARWLLAVQSAARGLSTANRLLPALCRPQPQASAAYSTQPSPHCCSPSSSNACVCLHRRRR